MKRDPHKELVEFWESLLTSEGLQVIEIDKNDANRIIVFKKASWSERDARQEYYLLLAEYIYSKAPEFDDSIDHFVMHKFSVGYNNKEICRILEEMGEKRHRKTIMYIRRKYESRWGLRKWAPHQLKSRKKKDLK